MTHDALVSPPAIRYRETRILSGTRALRVPGNLGRTSQGACSPGRRRDTGGDVVNGRTGRHNEVSARDGLACSGWFTGSGRKEHPMSSPSSYRLIIELDVPDGVVPLHVARLVREAAVPGTAVVCRVAGHSPSVQAARPITPPVVRVLESVR